MAQPTHFIVPVGEWLKIALEGNDPWPIRAKKLKALVEANGFDFSPEAIQKRVKKRFPLNKTDTAEAYKAIGYTMFAGDLRAMKTRKPLSESEITAKLFKEAQSRFAFTLDKLDD